MRQLSQRQTCSRYLAMNSENRVRQQFICQEQKCPCRVCFFGTAKATHMRRINLRARTLCVHLQVIASYNAFSAPPLRSHGHVCGTDALATVAFVASTTLGMHWRRRGCCATAHSRLIPRGSSLHCQGTRYTSCNRHNLFVQARSSDGAVRAMCMTPDKLVVAASRFIKFLHMCSFVRCSSCAIFSLNAAVVASEYQ